MSYSPSALRMILLAIFVMPVTARGESVPRWTPHDVAFRDPQPVDHPFLVPFSATVTAPDGSTFESPGFFDGAGVWKIRVLPTQTGTWKLRTKSPRQALDNQSAEFVCRSPEKPGSHGRLRIDPTHPRHFVFEDGTRFFPLPYECDWLWAIDLGKPGLNTTVTFLDGLHEYGFNYVILNSYAHDTSWKPGRTGDDDLGPPALYAWAGTNESPDHTRFNLDYWRHYDRVIAALNDRGMIAHIFLKVYNKKVRWPERESTADDLFFRWMVARYAAYPNVVWDFSKESYKEKDLSYKKGRLKLVRSLDPYHHLVTVHDDDGPYDAGEYDGLVDFRSDQQHKNWRETLLDQRSRSKWPLFNVEFGYEEGPRGASDKTYQVTQTAEEFALRAWEVSMAGAYTAYYYTYTAWDVVRPLDRPRGYPYFRNLRNFFERTSYWTLEPADALSLDGPCLADIGREYVVFQRSAKPIRLAIEKAVGELPVTWYHPLTGKRQDAGHIGNGRSTFAPPNGWGAEPAVLHVGSFVSPEARP